MSGNGVLTGTPETITRRVPPTIPPVPLWERKKRSEEVRGLHPNPPAEHGIDTKQAHEVIFALSDSESSRTKPQHGMLLMRPPGNENRTGATRSQTFCRLRFLRSNVRLQRFCRCHCEAGRMAYAQMRADAVRPYRTAIAIPRNARLSVIRLDRREAGPTVGGRERTTWFEAPKQQLSMHVTMVASAARERHR